MNDKTSIARRMAGHVLMVALFGWEFDRIPLPRTVAGAAKLIDERFFAPLKPKSGCSDLATDYAIAFTSAAGPLAVSDTDAASAAISGVFDFEDTKFEHVTEFVDVVMKLVTAYEPVVAELADVFEAFGRVVWSDVEFAEARIRGPLIGQITQPRKYLPAHVAGSKDPVGDFHGEPFYETLDAIDLTRGLEPSPLEARLDAEDEDDDGPSSGSRHAPFDTVRVPDPQPSRVSS